VALGLAAGWSRRALVRRADDKSVSEISILIARIVMAEVRFLKDILP